MRPLPLFASLLGLTFVACSADLPVEDGAIAKSQAPVTSTSSTPRKKLLPSAEKVPGQYIVVLNDNTTNVPAVASEQARAVGGQLGRTYQHALRGYVLRANEASARRLLDDSRVKYVAEDGLAHADAIQPEATWGLDRVDQRLLPLDQTYRYNATGAGVTAYVIDTGIRITHQEFGGRASHGFSSIDDGYGSDDCHGHGTHVAGTVGGGVYGVAKGVNLVAVRVLDCYGSGTWSGVIAGIDWVTANRVLPAVANMSLGGIGNQAVDDAVTNSIDSGVTYAVAAGNSGASACDFSPARTPAALTAAASSDVDMRAFFSNYGACVDLYAPGVDVTSAWNFSDTAIRTLSGTSMASPHVAGAAALFLGENPAATPAEVEAALKSSATPDAIIDPGNDTPNLLLYSAFIGDGEGGDQTPPAAELTSPTGGATISGTVELQANASDDTGVAIVIFYADGSYIGSDNTAPYSVSFDTAAGPNGARGLKVRAFDAAGNIGQSAEVLVTVNNPGYAGYDPVLQAPRCDDAGPLCDSGALLNGRGPLGPEQHAPNTIHGSCADGITGVYHVDESLDRLQIYTLDGSPLAPGRPVEIDATVWAWNGYYDVLDLYHAPDATNPAWTYLTTLYPFESGERVLSTTFILPIGGELQAIRGVFRYAGEPTTCSAGIYDDHDDLVFAVGAPVYPPVAAFTPSCHGLNCTFTDASTDQDSTIVDWYWYFGDGTTSTERNPSHVYAEGGTYTVVLVVTDSQGLTGELFYEITVSGLAPVAAFTDSCNGRYCSFTDASTDEDSTIVSWSWSFGDGYSTTLRNPQHVYFTAGTYTVTLTVTDSQGLTSTSSRTVTTKGPRPRP